MVSCAARAGVELLALSDHDTVDGVPEAERAARAHGLRLVSAVEISALDAPGTAGGGPAAGPASPPDLHILGYGIDVRDPILLARLEDFRADRFRRGEAMAQALRELGFELDEPALAARVQAGESLGRPHLAQAVTSVAGNGPRLAEEGLGDSSAFLVAYLIEGRPAFRTRSHPTVAEAIEAIHEAGGVAVWAHPFWDIPEPDRVLATIERFRRAGLDGVECFYATHTEAQTLLLADHCSAQGLLMTGSADFHGPGHRLFSRFRAFETYGRSPVLGPIG